MNFKKSHNDGQVKSSLWYLDSGCSTHMTGDPRLLTDIKYHKGPLVQFGGSKGGKTIGNDTLFCGSISFSDISLVQGLEHNLFSISQFSDKGLNIVFDKNTCMVMDPLTKDVKFHGKRDGNVYVVILGNLNTYGSLCLLSKASRDVSWLWHKRIAHLNFKTMSKLVALDLVKGLPKVIFEKDSPCRDCQLGKQTKVSFKSTGSSSISQPLQLLHMDLCGPVAVPSISGARYMLVVIDDYSRYTWVIFQSSKRHTFENLKELFNWISNLNDLSIKCIRSDHGT